MNGFLVTFFRSCEASARTTISGGIERYGTRVRITVARDGEPTLSARMRSAAFST
jgi:hypothetical protein